MARNLDIAFSEFIDGLRATPTETMAAASHRASISAKLKEAFGMTAFFRTGSFGNGTNVSGYSDVDYFAVIPTESLKANSQTTLSQVAACLRERFPTTSNVRVNSPGVQIPFGLDGAEHTEIIPVDATGTTKLGFRQFDMPDGSGGWMFSAPESHNAFVRYHDKRLGDKLRPLIRCLKAWKFYRNVPIRSFYLEMFTTACMINESAIVYSIDIRTVLSRLVDCGAATIIDPRFSDQTITSCSTETQRQDIIAKASSAAAWAAEARDLENANLLPRAFEKWDLVFNYNFPSYTFF